MNSDQRLRLAVFIDFDNIEIGVKQTLNASFDAGIVLEALKERGDVVSKTAYSDWQRAGGHSRMLTQHAIKMVQRNLTPGGDKNGADINLALDALEMAFTHPHINAFVIVGGDSDFISLVEKLKQYDKKVFVVGGRQFTSGILQRNCHEFIAYENLVGATASAQSGEGGGRRHGGGRHVRVERTPIEQAIPLVTRALAVLTEREVSPQLGLLKSTLLQLDSTFSERSYRRGIVPRLRGKAGGDWRAACAAGQGRMAGRAARCRGAGAQPKIANGRSPRPGPRSGPNGRTGFGPVAVTGSPADGLAEFRRAARRGHGPPLADVSPQRETDSAIRPRRSSTSARTDTRHWSTCCVRRRRMASSASIAIGRAWCAFSRASSHRCPSRRRLLRRRSSSMPLLYPMHLLRPLSSMSRARRSNPMPSLKRFRRPSPPRAMSPVHGRPHAAAGVLQLHGSRAVRERPHRTSQTGPGLQ